MCAAWWECAGLGEGNGRLGWWGYTRHPPAKLPNEIPPGERIQTLCCLSILLGLWVENSYPVFQTAVLGMGYVFSNTADTAVGTVNLRLKKKG